MVTGIEVAGLTLAVLPLFINQIDGYVRGCEAAKLFKDKKYFQQHKRWKQSLRTEMIFLNHALKTTLYGHSKHSDVTPFFQTPNPVSPEWDINLLDGALQAALGVFYSDFQGNLEEVNSALETICQKLDIDPADDQSVSPKSPDQLCVCSCLRWRANIIASLIGTKLESQKYIMVS